LEIVVERDAERVTVRTAGEIDMLTAPQLDARLQELIADGVERLVVDFRDVTFIDSSGLHVLVRAATRLKERSDATSVQITSATPMVRRVLQITGLDALFGVNGTG
jgi:anti-anti-sigma factor